MMDITSNGILWRKAVSGTVMNDNFSDCATASSSASAESVQSPGLISAVSVGEKRKRNEHGESCNTGNHSVGSNDNRESVQPKISECAVLKFDKLREEVNFSVGQTWALYDKVDGMPRLYARIRKVSAPSFGLRITYLEPDPDDEKEIQWVEEDLPVSAGQFRLGENENTKDCSIFSHVTQCKKGSNTGHLTVFPRKGETWALFKNWDIHWSSDSDSHRKYEYEFVEILSDYADGSGVSVAFLHKAKGFASVFFQMGTGDADIIQIPPHSLYRFSHMIPSFKMAGVEGKGLPKDAYELDQAALPETVEEKTVPSHLIAKPKPEALCFPRDGKVFQTGLSSAVKLGEMRKRNKYGESFSTENRSKSKDVIVNLTKNCGSSRRVSNDNGDVGEEFESGKQLHEVNLCRETLPNDKNRNDQLNSKLAAQVGAAVGISQNLGTSSEVAVQPESSECADPKFNDFSKLREEVNFAVGQTWALYDTADGRPRRYAQIKSVSAPSFRLRITYIEPNPYDKKEIQWCQEGLPVSAGNFILGKNAITTDRSTFSHVVQCNEGRTTFHFTVSPRKGETWALFKNWNIKWSSEPNSHRNYEYEFVEILSDYAHETGVYVSYLHKAKGFASVFFRTGTGHADIFRILPHSLYRFSHMVPSFKLTGTEGKGVPKNAYELDQAALPITIEEIVVPSNTDCNRNPKRQDIYFASKGNVFQSGQIWSFYSGNYDLPLYYCKIQKITFTQAFKQEAVFKLHIGRLKASPFPMDVLEWEAKGMPVGCGTFYARKALEIISPSEVSHQVMPEISMDGKEYTILPKIGEVWVIYRYWSCHIDVEDLEFGLYDIVQVLDDTLDYKVLLLVQESLHNDDKNENVYFKGAPEYRYNEAGGSEPIFTIPKSERLRFSNKVPALRVTKEIYGELKDLFSVFNAAVPFNVLHN